MVDKINNPLPAYFGKDILKTFDWKDRVLMVLGSLCCLYRRIKGYDDDGRLVYTGWYDCRKNVTFITWIRE